MESSGVNENKILFPDKTESQKNSPSQAPEKPWYAFFTDLFTSEEKEDNVMLEEIIKDYNHEEKTDKLNEEISPEGKEKGEEIYRQNEEIFNFEDKQKEGYNKLKTEIANLDLEINEKTAKGEDVSKLQTKKASMQSRADELCLSDNELDPDRYNYLKTKEGQKDLDNERQAECNRANSTHKDYDPQYTQLLKDEIAEAKENKEKGTIATGALIAASILFPPLIPLAIIAGFYTLCQQKTISDNTNILKGKKDRIEMPKVPKFMKKAAKNLINTIKPKEKETSKQQPQRQETQPEKKEQLQETKESTKKQVLNEEKRIERREENLTTAYQKKMLKKSEQQTQETVEVKKEEFVKPREEQKEEPQQQTQETVEVKKEESFIENISNSIKNFFRFSPESAEKLKEEKKEIKNENEKNNKKMFNMTEESLYKATGQETATNQTRKRRRIFQDFK